MKRAAADSAPPQSPKSDVAMGSEYMDASSYLKKPVRPLRVKDSGEVDHGSNDTDFGSTKLVEK